jgi:5-methylcytosine-specific restriction protein A
MAELPRDENGLLTREVYGHKEWAKLRSRHLKYHPWCVYCAEVGITERATHVDHRVPHRGSDELFFDTNNLQSLCFVHHNSTKQKEELSGMDAGCDITGWPRGENHFWNGGDPLAKSRALTQSQVYAKVRSKVKPRGRS